MDVPRGRFETDVVKIIQEVADSHFIAFDLEFSGVAGRTIRAGKPTLQEYYEEVREAADKYAILQVGLTIVSEDETGQYTVKPYNFNITQTTPLHERHFKRTWSMNSGAVGFLMRNRFDFGQQIAHGMHYLSRDEESAARTSLRGLDNVKRPDMTFKIEDDALVSHVRSAVNSWLLQSETTRENYLNIPTEQRGKRVPGVLNRYQMRLTHQIIQNEYQKLRSVSMHGFVQITSPTAEETNAQNALLEQNVEREVSRAVGFRWLLEAIVAADIRKIPDEYWLNALPKASNPKAGESSLRTFAIELNKKLSKRRRVLVGHNCFTDLVNLLKLIKGDLPDKVEDFADSVRDLFPAVVDTKHMASYGSARWGDTSLAKVAEDLQLETTPIVKVPHDFDRYRHDTCQHEAGYDSLQTAMIAIKLSSKMHREGQYLAQATPNDHQSTGSARFGEEEGYFTATESASEQSGFVDGRNDLQTPVPVTAAKAEDGLDHAPSTSSDPSARGTSTSKSVPEVIAVKQQPSKLGSSRATAEVVRLRNSYSSATIYDVLDSESKDISPDQELDLMSFNDNESTGSEHKKQAGITKLAEQGQLMPRWDSQYWKIFGNKLQVNGCKEGVCEL